MSKTTDCFKRDRGRAEGVILYQDKPIIGINRVYLLENTSTVPVYNNNIAQIPEFTKEQINQIVEAQNKKNKDFLIKIMDNVKTIDGKSVMYAIIDHGKKLRVYVDKKKYSNCKNLGGQIERGERPRDAFFREVYEETGYDLNDAITNGSVYDCIDGKFVITLNTQSYNKMIESYNLKYNNHATEIQTLFLGNNRIAGSEEYNLNGCKNHLSTKRTDRYGYKVTNESSLYLKKYLKYKAKYLALKKLIN